MAVLAWRDQGIDLLSGHSSTRFAVGSRLSQPAMPCPGVSRSVCWLRVALLDIDFSRSPT